MKDLVELQRLRGFAGAALKEKVTRREWKISSSDQMAVIRTPCGAGRQKS